MSESARANKHQPRHRRSRLALYAVLVLLLVGLLGGWWFHRRSVAAQLLRTVPGEILRNPALVREAASIARPQYERHCAGCHGTAMQGDQKRGVPDLARNLWLYGNDPVDVEHTILYGIRSGHPKAHNLTDMPPLIRMGLITTDDAHDAVEYLQSLAGQPHDEAAAERGRTIYFSKGNCYDCHANDAKGVTDYGTPALTGPFYLYGGDRDTLYHSLLNGRHGICPAWVNQLSPVQIRALAIYLVTAPRPSAVARN
jgi:cytochrome c oxidase cbb3-type subunit III